MKKIKKILNKRRQERNINRAEHIKAFNNYSESLKKGSNLDESAQRLSRQSGEIGFF